MIKTILAIVISVTFFGVLFFIIVRNLLKSKLTQLVEDEKKRKKLSNLK
jgi:anaerobic C4-dicarboxylate transporter